MASVKCGVVWGRNPHGKDQIQIPRHRSVVLSLPHFHLFAPAVQYSKKTIPTHSHPAPAGCELLQLQKSRVNLSSKPNRPDHQTEPIARPLLHTYYTASIHDTTAHSDRRPRTGGPTSSPQHHQPTEPNNMGSTSPTAHGSISSETPASANRASSSSSGHRCFVCNRTYERADHLNRHLKSRKQCLPGGDLLLPYSCCVDDNERAYKCPECGKGFNRA